MYDVMIIVKLFLCLKQHECLYFKSFENWKIAVIHILHCICSSNVGEIFRRTFTI